MKRVFHILGYSIILTSLFLSIITFAFIVKDGFVIIPEPNIFVAGIELTAFVFGFGYALASFKRELFE